MTPAFAGAGLFRKPVPTPHQVWGRLFGIMRSAVRSALHGDRLPAAKARFGKYLRVDAAHWPPASERQSQLLTHAALASLVEAGRCGGDMGAERHIGHAQQRIV